MSRSARSRRPHLLRTLTHPSWRSDSFPAGAVGIPAWHSEQPAASASLGDGPAQALGGGPARQLLGRGWGGAGESPVSSAIWPVSWLLAAAASAVASSGAETASGWRTLNSTLWKIRNRATKVT